jgi:branched-chain amino acid transport system ATP-binding protein
MTEEIILETRGLTKEFKGFVAVNGVDLRVKRGTIHALIGPNGAGKTTCFNLLTHFLTPTRDQIVYNGREITGTRPSAIARMGMVRCSRYRPHSPT